MATNRKTLACFVTATLVVSLLYASGVVGFSCFRLVDNEPLNEPVRSVRFFQDRLELSDGRTIVVSGSERSDLTRKLQDSDKWIEVEPMTADMFLLYAKQKQFICGLGAPKVTIPLIPVDVPKYCRVQAGIGKIEAGEGVLMRVNDDAADIAALVGAISKIDRSGHEIIASNGLFIVRTAAIDRIVAKGRLALPPLLKVMSAPETDFDTFVQCYSACAQILSDRRIKWNMHVHSEYIDGSERFVSVSIVGIEMDEFKRQVIQSVESNMR